MSRFSFCFEQPFWTEPRGGLICFRATTPNAELSASARSQVEPQGACVRLGQTVAPRFAQMWGGVGVE